METDGRLRMKVVKLKAEIPDKTQEREVMERRER
jgi:hypothetical protein